VPWALTDTRGTTTHANDTPFPPFGPNDVILNLGYDRSVKVMQVSPPGHHLLEGAVRRLNSLRGGNAESV